MAEIAELRCTVCERSYQEDEAQYHCPACGQVGTLDVLYDYEALAQIINPTKLARISEASMWRYKVLLPLAPESTVPPLRVGTTPLLGAPRVAASLGIRQAWVKDEGQNPTGSLKDRASAMVVARALEKGFGVVSTASTGNAAAALAGIGASVHSDLQVIIFVPASAPEAKIAQLLVYGATVLLVEDSYDVAFDLCFEMSQAEGWYCRNTGINPFTTEGKKTAAYEIAEQFGWRVPDAVVVSVGDGSIIGGLHKGFWEMLMMGWIKQMPRLIGIQAEGSSPLAQAWDKGIEAEDMQPVEAHTIADSISAGLPRDRVKAMRAVEETQGTFLTVSDDEILAAIPQLAQLTGVFAEPAAAAVYAGAQGAVQSEVIKSQERVVLLATGNGLKDVKRAQEAVSGGLNVEPSSEAVRRALGMD